VVESYTGNAKVSPRILLHHFYHHLKRKFWSHFFICTSSSTHRLLFEYCCERYGFRRQHTSRPWM